MANPSLITHYEVYSPGTDTSTLTTPAFTPANGEVVVVKLTTWDTNSPMAAPSGGGQTYQLAQVAAPGGFKCWSATYVCTVAGSPASFSISAAMPTTSTRHSMVVERWASAMLAATPAVFTSITGSAATMSAPFTTTAPNSVISWGMGEINSRDPAGRTYTPVTTVEDGLFDGHVGSNSVQYFGYTPEPTAGATTIGLSVPAGSLVWTISGVEILAQTAVVVDLAANLTGAGSLSVTLLREAPLSAALTATGGLGAALTREADLSAALTATGGMSATLGPDTVDLAAHFTATGGMTVTLNVPTLGPVDPIGSPVAQELLTCFTDQLSTLPSPPKYIQLRVGQETGPLIGENIDECCAGLAWIRIANIYPSWDSFPAPDNSWLPCGPLAYAVVLEMGVAFCMPWSDSDDSFENRDPPNTTDWATAAATQMQHQTLMRRSAACCWRPTQRRAVGEWSPLPVEGGCTGGKMLVTVSVPAPCADC